MPPVYGGGRELTMKKLLAAVLVLTVSTGLFTGCIGTKKTSSGKKVPDIIWYYPGDKLTDLTLVQDEMNKQLEPELGIWLQMKTVDSSAYKEKMNLVVSSGEKFDICFTANWSFPFMSNVTSGAFIPLSELIDKEAPKLKQALPEYLWGSTTVDNEIYAVPNYQILPTWFCLSTSKELKEKMNFDFSKIKDLKDLEPYLAAIKQEEPDLYPYMPSYSNVEMKYEQIYPTDFVVVGKTDSGIKAINRFELPEFKDYIKLMHDWYTKGYIRKDVVGASSDSSSLLNLKYAFFWGTIKPGGEIENMQKYKKEIVDIPMCDPYTQTSATARTLSAVSRTSDYPEKAIKLIEKINVDKDFFNLMAFGIEGKHYTKVSDNVVHITESTGYKMDAWKFGNQFNAYYKEGQATDTWEKTMKLNDESTISPIWGFNFNPEPVKNEISQCSAVVTEYKFLSLGAEEPDLNYSQFIQKLKDAGADRVTAEVQKQIDQWKEKK